MLTLARWIMLARLGVKVRHLVKGLRLGGGLTDMLVVLK
jgi:hypothetical protein